MDEVLLPAFGNSCECPTIYMNSILVLDAHNFGYLFQKEHCTSTQAFTYR